jgi:hypothetical protein
MMGSFFVFGTLFDVWVTNEYDTLFHEWVSFPEVAR